MTLVQAQKEFANLLNAERGKYRPLDKFRDFCRMAAISLAQVYYKSEELEAEYMSIVSKYTKEEANTFAEMLACVIFGLESKPHDFLGEAYMANDLGNSNRGQFFTPQPICDLMAKMQMSTTDETIEKKGFITAHEPACGAGATIIGLYNAMIEAKYNPQKQLYVEAIDLDPICADMAYIQLSLLAVPAKILTGDSLRWQFTRQLYTPMYFMDLWEHKLRRAEREGDVDDTNAVEIVEEIAEEVAVEVPQIIPSEVTKPTQGFFDLY